MSILTNLLGDDGCFENDVEILGQIYGRFFVGAYSKILDKSEVYNALIGRFSVIESGCIIGYHENRYDCFSNHDFFCNFFNNSNIDYYQKLKKSSRTYYECNKYTFIGNDVRIGCNSIIVEGVSIGDGAIIYPNSYVDFDVPEYAIVRGNPANIEKFRFDDELIELFKYVNWCDYDIPVIVSKFLLHRKEKKNLKATIYMNWIDCADDFIRYLYCSKNELTKLNFTRYYYNRNLNKLNQCNANKIIVGPSHIALWFRQYNCGKINKPVSAHLFPIDAVSLFSDTLDKLITWGRRYFGGGVVLFVPDFRIGNISCNRSKKDGIFISPEKLSLDNDLKCYELGLDKLKKFSLLGSIYFWFWCLWGRENYNKLHNSYVTDGKYKHPIWNYDNLLRQYSGSVIDINNYFDGSQIDSLVEDHSIHPTKATYDKMIDIFDNEDTYV